MPPQHPTNRDLSTLAAILRSGGVVAMPTETVYGLAADATNPAAVARVFEVKARPSFDPLIVHLADADDADRWGILPPAAQTLARAFWPGPLTLVVPRRTDPGPDGTPLPRIPDVVTAGLDTVGLRVPDHELARTLIRGAGAPLAAPSANLFGRVSPTCADHVRDQIGHLIDGVLDGGPCRVGLESTVVGFDEAGEPLLLRPGGVTEAELEAVLGRPVKRGVPVHARPNAPGQLASHYATGTPLHLLPEGQPVPPGRKGVGLLALREAAPGYAAVEVLSPVGDLRQAAAGLFAAMRRLDADPSVHEIWAELPTTKGLGVAIRDRLMRAATHP